MTTLLFYEKPGCGNNARQKQLLTAAGHRVIARNLLTVPCTTERLRDFFAALPVAEWFNRASPRIKSGEIVPEQIAPDAALALMLADPLLIRWPLMEAEGRRMAGFDAQQVEAWIGLRSEQEEYLQTCPRSHAAMPAKLMRRPSWISDFRKSIAWMAGSKPGAKRKTIARCRA